MAIIDGLSTVCIVASFAVPIGTLFFFLWLMSGTETLLNVSVNSSITFGLGGAALGYGIRHFMCSSRARSREAIIQELREAIRIREAEIERLKNAAEEVSPP